MALGAHNVGRGAGRSYVDPLLDWADTHLPTDPLGGDSMRFWAGSHMSYTDALVPPAPSASIRGPSAAKGFGTPAKSGEPGCGLIIEDDENAALQEAICRSLAEAELRRREEEEAELAVQAAAIAAEAEEEEQRREAEERSGREEATRRAKPMPPPPGLAETFAPKQWLSDASISFAYLQLAAGVTGTGELDGPVPDMVLLMDPAAAFWLTLQDDPAHVEEAKGALKLQDRQLVLCPINDSRDGSCADAGTHWTLLVCWDRSGDTCSGARSVSDSSNGGLFGRFSYYDSLGGASAWGSANLAQARTLASRLAGKDVQVSPGTCAHQTNGFDCGVYVLLFSEIIASAFLETRSQARPCRPSGNQWPGSAPVWEDRLTSVTPMEVAVRRARYFETIAAAAGTAGE